MIVRGIMPRNEATQKPSGSGFCRLLWLILNVRDLTIRNPPYGTSSSIEFEAHNYFLGDLNCRVLQKVVICSLVWGI